MALDTNVKKFNYSLLKKFICLLLCFITILAATNKIVVTMIGYEYFNDERPYNEVTDFTGSFLFEQNFVSDLSAVDWYLEKSKEYTEKENGFKKQRKETINSAYDKVMKLTPKLLEADVSDYDYIYELFHQQVSETVCKEKFSFYLDELRGYGIYGDDDDGEIRIDEDRIKERITKLYDDFVASALYDIDVYGLGCPPFYSNNLKIYAENDGYNTASIFSAGKLTAQQAKAHDIYYIYENGKLEYNGINEIVAESAKTCLDKGTTLYAYFDFPEYKSDNIIDTITRSTDFYDSKYEGVKDLFDTAKKSRENINKNVTLAVVYIVLSIIFGLLYLAVAGKKNKEDKAKLAFIDYLPVELHISALVGLAIGATVLFGSAIEVIEVSIYTAGVFMLYVASLWILATEFLGSMVRSFRSDRKWYKFFLIYWLLLVLVKLFKVIVKASKKSIARTKNRLNKLRALIVYKPKTLKLNVIFIAIAYFMFNILLTFIGVLTIYEEVAPITLLCILVFLAVNIFVIHRTVRYIAKLDEIIDSASKHEDIITDIETLPASLKVLAESMKYTNTELQNAVAKAVKDERLRTELITNVSHDLKTPLTSIINYVDLLSKCDISDPRAQEYIKVLDEKGAKLKRLIDDLIEASKVTSGNVTVNPIKINLSELCLQSTVETQADFEKAGLDLIVKECEKPPVIFADGSKTFRVIENLLSNARKYSAKASRVYVDVYSENGYGVFEIKNISAQPLDISPDELTERFVRGDKSRNLEGNGLGLSIAKELCNLQNGNLEIAIDGDLFKARVKLPLAK